MKTYTVREIMTPLSEYPVVRSEATFHEAVNLLKTTGEGSANKRMESGDILVMDADDRIIGKLNMMDLILGLEEGYRKIGDLNKLTYFGYDPKFIKSIIEKNQLWEKPLDEICRKATAISVKELLVHQQKADHIKADTSLDVAIHQFGMTSQQSFLVTDNQDIVGVLRSSDIFDLIHNAFGKCELPARAVS
ncbi:MAG: CBS domain-containing protein [Desulfobacteraceae bacterium]|nr:CBS domain-containing protein [Desulfobacteraceae bacterium]